MRAPSRTRMIRANPRRFFESGPESRIGANSRASSGATLPTGDADSMESKGFFGSLFDLSFSSLVTPRIIKIIYVITLIGIGLIAILFIISAFNASSGLGAVTLLIIAPIMSLFYIVYARVFLEFFIAIFRMAETNAELVSLKRIEMGLNVPPAPEPVTEAGT
jgi:hypothetical protein